MADISYPFRTIIGPYEYELAMCSDPDCGLRFYVRRDYITDIMFCPLCGGDTGDYPIEQEAKEI